MTETGTAPECGVAVNANRSPGALAMLTAEGDVSWAELDRMVRDRMCRRAGAPKVAGVIPGVIPGVIAERSVDLVVEIFAAARRGRAIALVSPRLPAGPADRFIRSAGAAAASWPAGPEAAESISGSAGLPDDASGVIPAPDAPLTYMQTSGSSGRPRIIEHSWRNHAVSAQRAVAALGLTARDRWLWSLPPHHVGGLSILFRCVEAGATIVLSGTLPGSDPGAASTPGDSRDAPPTLRAALLATKSTIVSCVPVQLQRMIEEGPCPPSVRNVIVGGASVPPELIERAVAAGYPVRTTYGSTESASMVTLSERFSGAPARVHAGRPLARDTVRIGSGGSIRIRGATIAVGRLEGGERIPITDENGWYETDDLGLFDEEGCLVVLGRADDVFISGGENISPRAVERALLEMGGVLEAVVVPIPSEEFGRRPVAFLDADGPVPDVDSVRDHLSGRLPGFMHPDAVFPLGAPPEGYLKWPREMLIDRATSDGRN